jgi:hypothetical protein
VKHHLSLRAEFTLGSRGDIQPLLALGKTMLAWGQQLTIVALPNFESETRSLGLAFAVLADDVRALIAANPD